MSEESNTWKKLILDILDFLRYKVENDKLTLSETESIAKTIESQLDLYGSISDFSRYYGKPKENVRVVISRGVIAKPVRILLYPFKAFRKAKPRGWK